MPSLEKIKSRENAHPQPLIQSYLLKNHPDRELGVNFKEVLIYLWLHTYLVEAGFYTLLLELCLKFGFDVRQQKS